MTKISFDIQQLYLLEESDPVQPGIGSPPSRFGQTMSPKQSLSSSYNAKRQRIVLASIDNRIHERSFSFQLTQSPTHLAQGLVGEHEFEYESGGEDVGGEELGGEDVRGEVAGGAVSVLPVPTALGSTQ